jgi:threonyl-tRNA synthetase
VAIELEEIEESKAEISSAYRQMIKKLNDPFNNNEDNELMALCSEIKISLVVSSGVKAANKPEEMSQEVSGDDKGLKEKLKKLLSAREETEKRRAVELEDARK